MRALAVTNLDVEPKPEILVAGALNLAGGNCALWDEFPSDDPQLFFCGADPVDFAIGRQAGEALMFVADRSSKVIQIVRPVPGGPSQHLASIPTESPPLALAVADLNADGRLDVAVAGEDTIEIFIASD